MSHDSKPNQPFSLASEIKKRRSKKLAEDILARRHHSAQPSSDKKQPKVVPHYVPEREKANGQPTPITRNVQRPHRTVYARIISQRQLLLSGTVSLVVVFLLLIPVLLANPGGPRIVAALPMSSANAIFIHLRQVGLPLSNIQPLKLPANPLNAAAGFQFEVRNANGEGRFLLLDYIGQQQARQDAFKAAIDRTYRNWRTLPLSNILILASPGTPQELYDEVVSHILQHSVKPHRPMMPTATDQPIG